MSAEPRMSADAGFGARPAQPLAASLALLALLGCASPEPPLPEYMSLPEIRLTDQLGEPYGSEELRGKVWVADFVFTSCPSLCPMLTRRMAELQRDTVDLAEQIRFVSFSVDPETDTPPVMRAFAEAHGADASTWRFLTGPTEQMRATIVDGFRVHVGERQPLPGGGYDIAHSPTFILVDARLRVRGFYSSNDEDAQRQLRRDIRRLTGGS